MHEGHIYLADFIEKMKDRLDHCEAERGDAWLDIEQKDQTDLLERYFVNTIQDNLRNNKPIPWVDFAVECMLAHVRDTDPGRFNK